MSGRITRCAIHAEGSAPAPFGLLDALRIAQSSTGEVHRIRRSDAHFRPAPAVHWATRNASLPIRISRALTRNLADASTSRTWIPRFEQLTHETALVAFAVRLSGSRCDACDLVQDMLGAFASFTPGTHGRAWLFTILRHGARCIGLRLFRAAPRRDRGADRRVRERVPDARARLALVRGDRIPPGIPTNTVGTRLLRARQKLRTMLEASENGVSSSADVTDR
jgi:hypothetical protein